MGNYQKGSDGMYLINGKKYQFIRGSRAQVWHGTAYKTNGGLIKSKLMKNKHGRIVSASKHKTAKKQKRLVKAGYITTKGKFGSVKKGGSSLLDTAMPLSGGKKHSKKKHSKKKHLLSADVGANMGIAHPHMGINLKGGKKHSKKKHSRKKHLLSAEVGANMGIAHPHMDINLKGGKKSHKKHKGKYLNTNMGLNVLGHGANIKAGIGGRK